MASNLHKHVCVCVCVFFQVACYGTQFVCNIIFIFIFSSSKLWYPICKQVFFQIMFFFGFVGGGGGGGGYETV
jgi:hypothetical protein